MKKENETSFEDKDNKSRMLASLKIERWKTKELFKNKKLAKLKKYENIETDFTFGRYKAVWNKKVYYEDWLENSDVFEVGCVHTAQGKDFGYVGVMFADDISEVNGEVIASNEIKNQYYILLTRGIYGHGLHIPDENMKKRFKRFLERIE